MGGLKNKSNVLVEDYDIADDGKMNRRHWAYFIADPSKIYLIKIKWHSAAFKICDIGNAFEK